MVIEAEEPADPSIAGLPRDLKQRGLLNETPGVWAGEFGHRPVMHGSRGHNSGSEPEGVVLGRGGQEPSGFVLRAPRPHSKKSHFIPPT